MKLTVVLCLCLLATYSCSSVSATRSNLPSLNIEDGKDEGKDEDKVEPFKELIGNIQDTLGVIDKGVDLFGKVLDLFGSETSETLEREFTERGYESFVAKTQLRKGTNVRMKDYRAEMESALQNMDIFKKMPKSYKRQVAATVSAFYRIPKEEGTWYDTDFVFKAGTKGKAHSIHIYFYRQANDFTRCDNFHYLIMGNTFDFEMADDIFVISKSKSSMGGRFKSTKLEWKKRDAAIKEADITFITATFQATALGVIERERLKNTELTCTPFKKPKKPWKDIKFDMMDDSATYDFGSEIGYEYQPAGSQNFPPPMKQRSMFRGAEKREKRREEREKRREEREKRREEKREKRREEREKRRPHIRPPGYNPPPPSFRPPVYLVPKRPSYLFDEEEENVGGGSGEAEYYYAAGGFHRL